MHHAQLDNYNRVQEVTQGKGANFTRNEKMSKPSLCCPHIARMLHFQRIELMLYSCMLAGCL